MDRKTPQTHDAVALLVADHREVKAMFEKYETLGERAYAGKKKLADEICDALTLHATVEEEIFYPSVRRAERDARDMVDEAVVEHASAKDLIAQIRAMDAEEALYDAKVKVLGELIDHHVEEEEDEMFPSVKKTSLDLAALADRIAQRKQELTAQGI